MIPLSLCSSEKLGGATSIFSAVHFALFPFKPHDGEMPSPKIGSLPGFSDRSIRPEPLSAVTRITNELTRHLQSICSGGTGCRDSLLMKRWRKRGRGPCFEHFVSERRQTRGWNGRRECDSVRNLWPHPEVFANCEAIAESGANHGNPVRRYCRTAVGVKMI